MQAFEPLPRQGVALHHLVIDDTRRIYLVPRYPGGWEARERWYGPGTDGWRRVPADQEAPLLDLLGATSRTSTEPRRETAPEQLPDGCQRRVR